MTRSLLARIGFALVLSSVGCAASGPDVSHEAPMQGARPASAAATDLDAGADAGPGADVRVDAGAAAEPGGEADRISSGRSLSSVADGAARAQGSDVQGRSDVQGQDDGPPPVRPPDSPPRRHHRVLSEGAEAGDRDVEATLSHLSRFVSEQRYGAAPQMKVDPKPKNRTGTGGASSFEPLKHDPMELQHQVQFVEDTSTNLRFGFVSVRAQRLYRYGRLVASRILFERIPGGQDEVFDADFSQLQSALVGPQGQRWLGERFRVLRSNLESVEPGARSRPKVIFLEVAPVKKGKTRT